MEFSATVLQYYTRIWQYYIFMYVTMYVWTGSIIIYNGILYNNIDGIYVCYYNYYYRDDVPIIHIIIVLNTWWPKTLKFVLTKKGDR